MGQSEQFLIPKIVSHFRRRARTIELGNTHVVRDFGDVRDVARTYVTLTQAKPIGMIVNICTGTGYSLGDIIQKLSEISGLEVDIQINPDFVRHGEVDRLVGSRNLLNSIIGDPPLIPLEQTLAWMMEHKVTS